MSTILDLNYQAHSAREKPKAFRFKPILVRKPEVLMLFPEFNHKRPLITHMNQVERDE